ncbi:DNA polymerase III subunit gamma/tau [Allofranklinella schreckenbergeri]|uniref:DNA polymerase III subunit gamma/tau n=1 Tax=Allofranklinella schreckenbergeri TaxID=1076744 RepID=A0A3M6Q6N8_9BURK|nr:DNA polymerase III subunit gamma/tau [Allofranklinella schreckenbergeri]RMW98842.1 DNA polymerase III subunit gamma/tau [Allofranklinella schreckenbergeri]
MSYLVLARKYRPHNFDEMVGQEHVVKALSNALAQKRLHHAYLFTGTRGVGKTTVSRILAKSLNCQGADGQGDITAHPCGQCQACQDIDAGRFVDYTELDAASNRGVEEVQSLMEQAVYKPVQGRFKVFMIDEVHMLSNTAFNAMLKTLEEPPEYLKFVLATTDPQKVPVTVLSRCLQFNLRPMAPQTIVEHLERVLGQEGVAQDRPALQLLARAARGSMRDALSLTDQAIAYGNGALSEATVRQMLGVVDKRYVFDAIAALAAGDGQAVVALVDMLRQQGIPAASLLEDMALALQKMALYQSLPQHSGEALDEADAARIQALAAQMPADETQLLYTFCLKGREELGLAPDEYAGLVMVLLRLLAFKLPPGAGLAGGATPPAPVAAPPGGPAADGAGGQQSVAAVPAASAAPAATAPATAAPTTATPALVANAPAVAVQAAPAASTTAAPAVDRSPAHPARQTNAAAPQAAPAQAAAEPLPWEDGPAPAAPAVTVAMPADETPAPQARTAADADAVATPMAQAPAATQVREAAAPTTPPAAEATAAAPATASAPAPTASAQDTAWWHDNVQTLIAQGQLTALVRELALQAQLQQREGEGVLLRVANQTLMAETLRTKLQDVLLAAGLAQTVALEQGEVTASLAQRLEADKAAAQRIAQSIVEADARVQWLQTHWGAQIVPGSVKPVSVAVR